MFKHKLPNGTTIKYNFLKDRTAHKIIFTSVAIAALAIFYENKVYLDGVDDAIRSLQDNSYDKD